MEHPIVRISKSHFSKSFKNEFLFLEDMVTVRHAAKNYIKIVLRAFSEVHQLCIKTFFGQGLVQALQGQSMPLLVPEMVWDVRK